MPVIPPVLSRGDIKKTPGRLVFSGVSVYSKLNTAIERTITHDLMTIGIDAAGELDYRDKEFYGKVRITPDGRFGPDTAAMLWPYGNYQASQPIFATGVDKQLVVHGTDGSLETFASAALDVMPPMKFAATETIVGQAEFLCLRKDGAYWADPNSFVTQLEAGGTIVDNGGAGTDGAFTPAQIITGPYLATWGPATPLTISTFDTLEGFTVEFSIQWSDDTRQSIGLTNRRIKAINARVRCSPLGQMRETILLAEQMQGANAKRGRSIQAGNSADLQIVDYNGVVQFTLKNAALTEDKQNWSSEAVRETDLVWQGTRSYAAGVLGPLFTVLA